MYAELTRTSWRLSSCQMIGAETTIRGSLRGRPDFEWSYCSANSESDCATPKMGGSCFATTYKLS
jgi:hypothetical protein